MNNKIKKRLASNFLSLSVLQLVSYIFPLLTIPYLVRTLGIDNFGILAFVTSIILLFQMITLYGFDLTATRNISIHRDDKRKLSEIYSAVLNIKLILLLFSFIILSILIVSVNIFREHWLMYYFSFGTVIGSVLFPNWFFQGIEDMKFITIISVLSKIISTSAIFLFVQEAEDLLIVPLLYSIGAIIPSLISLYIVKYKYNIIFYLVSIDTFLFYLKDGWHVFFSHIGTNMYTNSLVIILGFFTNESIVGYYASADKLIKAIIALSRPIYQTVYPYIMSLIKKSEQKAILLIKKIILLTVIINIVIALFIFIFSENIIVFMYGENYELSIVLLNILALQPLIVGLNNIIGVQTMLAYDYKEAFSKVLFFIGIGSIPFSMLSAYYYGAVGIAIISLIIEFMILIILNIYLYHKKVYLFRRGNAFA